MNNNKPTYSKLIDDSINFAKVNLYTSIEIIDEKFGKGFHKKHPEVVTSFLQVIAKEFSGIVVSNAITDLKEELSEEMKNIQNGINAVAYQVEKLE